MSSTAREFGPHRPAAVVVGLDCITGLQTARILAGRGVRVVGVASDLRHFACRTRVCERIVRADLHGDGLVDALERLGPSLGAPPAVVVPCTDGSVLAISRHRHRLEPWYRVVLPPPAMVETLMDKVSFAEHAERTGLPVPRTAVLRTHEDAVRAAARMTFPCVLKPRVKTPAWEEHSPERAYVLRAAEELLPLHQRLAPWTDGLLLQEWIEGGNDALYSCNCYVDAAGRARVTFVARKLRQWPPDVGTSCLGEEVRNDDVLELALRVFEGTGYRGLGYLEVKRDARNGRHVIIEPNVGRPTGRSAIAEAGGVELLLTMYCDAAGLPLPEARQQHYRGVKWLDLRRDLQASVHEMRRGVLGWHEWRRTLRGPLAHAVLSRRDPLPFAAELLQSAGKAARRAVRRP